MDIYFSTSKLQKLCNTEKKLKGEYGSRMAALIQQRLVELADAQVLEIMRTVVGARCHELKADLKGYLAVDLVHPMRLLFKPVDPPPQKEDGGLDWTKVTAITVEGIDDYH